MIERQGDMFDVECDALCITTNGWVHPRTGYGVMGRGVAKTAATYWPWLPRLLGLRLEQRGNVVQRLVAPEHWGRVQGLREPCAGSLVAFPVKAVTEYAQKGLANVVRHKRHEFKVGDVVPGWACLARPDIIRESAQQLRELTDHYGWHRVALSRPGCGAGGLSWVDVKPILEPYLDDDRFCIHSL